MERYEAYKDSGVEWIGEIPENWELRRISALYDARNEKVSDQDYPPLSVTMQGIVPQLETAAKTQDGDNRKLVRIGDFVINSRSDRRGACGISAYDGSVTLISNVLAPKVKDVMSTRYYSYLFRSEGFADEFYRQGTGIVDDLWSTNWSRMKNILVARPPQAEQECIADYLDAKTAEIDALVADCEREVELLREYRKAVISEAVTKGLDPNAPMKDSGIEWIGEIPENWKLPRLGMLLSGMKDGTHSTHIRVDNGHPLLSAKNVRETSILISNHESMIGEEDYQAIVSCGYPRKGDVLLTTIGGSIGRAVVYSLAEMHAFQRSVMFLRPIQALLDSHYLCYMLRSNLMQKQMFERAAASAQDGIYSGDIARYKAVLPPLSEQITIANYLDAKTAEIDSLIDSKQQMADKLREYRRSLISEAVTGKFKVPGVSA